MKKEGQLSTVAFIKAEAMQIELILKVKKKQNLQLAQMEQTEMEPSQSPLNKWMVKIQIILELWEEMDTRDKTFTLAINQIEMNQ